MAAFVVCAAACAGGQTGDEDALTDPGFVPPGQGATQNNRCLVREQGQVLAVGEASPDGFAARDVLAFAEGTHRSELRFLASPEGRAPGAASDTLDIKPSAHDTPLTVELHYEGGEVRYFASTQREISCYGRLEIEVRLSLRTADGALDEGFQATLAARGPHEARVQVSARPASAAPRGEVPPPLAQPAVHELQGALEVTAPERGETSLGWLDAHLMFSSLGVRGSLMAWIRYGGRGAFLVELARFGAHCGDRYGFAIEPEQALPSGLSPQDALDRLQQLPPALALFAGGETDTLNISFEYAQASACARLHDEVPGAALGSVQLQGALSLLSASGRLHASQDTAWPVSVTATVEREGGEPSLSFTLSQKLGARPDLERDWGIAGVSAQAFDLVDLELDATLAASGELTGEIMLTGYELPEVVPQDRPLNSDALPASELLRARLGAAP